MATNNSNNNTGGGNKSPKGFKFNIFWMYGLITLIIVASYFFNDNSLSQKVSWSEFETWVNKGGVTKITVITNSNEAQGLLTDSLAGVVFTDMCTDLERCSDQALNIATAMVPGRDERAAKRLTRGSRRQ